MATARRAELAANARIPRQPGSVDDRGKDRSLVLGMLGIARRMNDRIRQADSIRDEVQNAISQIERMPFNATDYRQRIERIDIDDLDAAQFVASIIAAAQCPSWCDDCCPDDIGTSPIHSGLIRRITNRANQDEVTVEVRIERQDINGVPGSAYVALRQIKVSSMLEFSPKAAGELAAAIVEAQRAVLRDQASPEGGGAR